MTPRYSALCCYFGQWPTHFGCWLKTCSFNTGIDFILVTDIPTEGYEVPENVRLVKKSFQEVRTLVASKFSEIQVSLDWPYKLCDFKTAYGYIFEDLFQGYDYWGYYDIDTLWGDILKFIPTNEDAHLVKIFPCGHLSFIRNLAPWNKIYELVNQVADTPCRNNMSGKSVVSWQECFSTPESHYYDEEGGLEPLFQSFSNGADSLNHKLSTLIFSEVTFDNLLPPWRFDHFYSINFPEKSHFLVYSFDHGYLFRHYLKGCKVQKEEISYVHFSKRRIAINVKNDAFQFLLCPNKIVSWKNLTVLLLITYGRKRYIGNFVSRLFKKAFDL